MAEYALKGVSSRSSGDTRDAATLSRSDFITVAATHPWPLYRRMYLCNRARGTLRLLLIEESRTSLPSSILYSAPIAVVRRSNSISDFDLSQRTRERSTMPRVRDARHPLEITFYAIMRTIMRFEIKLRARPCEINDVARYHRTSRALILSGGRDVTVFTHFSAFASFHGSRHVRDFIELSTSMSDSVIESIA